MTDSKSNNIVDATGAPIRRPPTVRDRVKDASKSSRRVILWIVSVIAILATLITNSGKIIETVWPKKVESSSKVIKVPDVALKLRNTGDVEIAIPNRGEYWLWPPGGGVQHYSGAYEFRHLDNSDLESQLITVPSNGERAFLVHLTNSALAGYLATGDYSIDFIFRTNQNERNMVWSGPIPFTETAMSKAYLIDVYEEADVNEL